MTRWDANVMARAAVFAGLALGLVFALTAATDEGNVTWGERLGRAVPLAPFAAAVGVWGALAPVQARGEARALLALGRTQAQVAAAAVSGGAGIALVTAAAIALVSPVSLAGFYPTATHLRPWRWQDSAFVEPARGLRVGADGTPQRLDVTAPPVRNESAIPGHGRFAASFVTGATGLALAALTARSVLETRRRRRLVARGASLAALVAATLFSTVVLFQAAAVRRVPAPLGCVPPLGLMLFALRRYGAPS
jgi:hypothetical protein